MEQWNAEVLEVSGAYKYRILQNSSPLSYSDILKNWKSTHEFSIWFTRLLGAVPFSAFFWECLPVTTRSVKQPFEFVALPAPQLLQMNVNQSAFQSYFLDPVNTEEYVGFESLGRDAYLIAPKPCEPLISCAHLASYVRSDPIEKKAELWAYVAAALENRISDRSLWLSTSGLGIAWLHVRLDTRPKYYQWEPYSLDISDCKN